MLSLKQVSALPQALLNFAQGFGFLKSYAMKPDLYVIHLMVKERPPESDTSLHSIKMESGMTDTDVNICVDYEVSVSLTIKCINFEVELMFIEIIEGMSFIPNGCLTLDNCYSLQYQLAN